MAPLITADKIIASGTFAFVESSSAIGAMATIAPTDVPVAVDMKLVIIKIPAVIY